MRLTASERQQHFVAIGARCVELDACCAGELADSQTGEKKMDKSEGMFKKDGQTDLQMDKQTERQTDWHREINWKQRDGQTDKANREKIAAEREIQRQTDKWRTKDKRI